MLFSNEEELEEQDVVASIKEDVYNDLRVFIHTYYPKDFQNEDLMWNLSLKEKLEDHVPNFKQTIIGLGMKLLEGKDITQDLSVFPEQAREGILKLAEIRGRLLWMDKIIIETKTALKTKGVNIVDELPGLPETLL